jgi:hypothetical protein
MGEAAFVAVKATRGGKKPLVLLDTSNTADATGVEVPIPTCDNTQIGKHINSNMSILQVVMDGFLIKSEYKF